ncbi:hypothetical protein EDC01DRAFT_377325 [Geopyxis carbonaria]|nr:hypothetical protein EDC01DRAFT_377325 [Geopyxis carbonaria]
MQFPTLSILAVALGASGALGEISINSTNTEYGYKGEMRGLSEKCSVAYSAKIQCSDLLFKFRNATLGPELFTESNLKDLCTTDCIDSLNDWDKKIQEDCNEKDQEQMEDPSGNTPIYFHMALMSFHEIQENLYWPFCIKDQSDDSFCLLKPGLPAWPTKASDASKDSDFCKSACRAQQSYLLFAASGGSTSLANCPDANSSTYEMNVISTKAFGTPISDKDNKAKQSTGMLKGTGYNITTMFLGEAVANASTSVSGSAVASASGAANSTAADQSIAVNVSSGTSRVLVVVAVVGAFTLLL